MASPLLLNYAKSNDYFILTTDASEVGLGAVNRKRLHHGLLLWKIHGAHVTLHDHEIYWIWNHSVKYYLICQQNTLCSRNQVFHNREGMLSYCVGSQEVSPLLDWDTIYSQNWAQTPRVARLCKKAKPFLMFRTLVRVYEFDILYQPGTQNQAVDVLCRCPVNLVTLNSSVTKTKLSGAQKADPVLKPVINHLLTNSPTLGIWRTFPYKCFKQLWS